MGEIATTLQTLDWYQEFIDELKGLLTEGEFTARYTLLQTYHTVGSAILERTFPEGVDPIKEVARALDKSPRLIYQTVQFAKKYPNLDDLPDGKAISWRTVANELLPAHGKRKPTDLKSQIDQFIIDDYPTERKERKEFIKAVIGDWEIWRK